MSASRTVAAHGNSLIAWFARNPVAANLLMIMILGAGLWSALTIEKRTLPDFAVDTVSIFVPYPGAGPRDVEQGVVLKIEEAIADTLGIERIHSVSREGAAEIRVTVAQSYDVDELLEEVKRRVDALPSLPRNSERPVISKIETHIRVLWLSLYGPQDTRQLRTAAVRVRDDLLAMPEIENVSIVGDPTQEISIEVDPRALRQYGLTFSGLAEIIGASSTDVAAGIMRTPGSNIAIRSIGQAYDRDDFGKIVVKTNPDGTRLFLADVATVLDSFEDNRTYARYNGQPALNLQVMSSEFASDTEISQRIREYTGEIRPELPAGLNIEPWADNSYYLQGRLNLMLGNLGMGAALVYLLLSLFLRLRVATWVVIGIPFSFLGALWLMPLPMFNISVNVISLFAFILVLGVVVDDAVITGEAVDQEIALHGPGVESVIRGTHAVALPSTLGVLTSIAAFAPMAFVVGQLRPIFATVSFVVVLCLVFSIVESKLILPAHLANGLNTGPDGRDGGRLARLQATFQAALQSFIARRYKPALERAIQRPGLVLAVATAVSLVVIGVMGSGAVRYEFFPTVPSELMRAKFTTYQSAPVGLRDDVLTAMEETVWALNDRYSTGDEDIVSSVMVFTSGDDGGEIIVELAGQEEHGVDAFNLLQEWRKSFGPVAGVKEIRFVASTDTGGGMPVDFRLSGQEQESLEMAAAEVVSRLKQYDAVVDVSSSSTYGKKEIRLSLKPLAENIGLSLREVGRQVRQAFYGEEVQRIQRGRDELKVWLRFPAAQRESLAELDNMWISTATGAVPLTEVAAVTLGTGNGELERIDRAPSISIQADIDRARVESRHVIAELREQILPQVLRRYPSVGFHLDGASQNQGESMASLMRAAVFALFLIYALMAIPLRSYVKPLLIMSVVPFGFIGAVLGHLLLGKAMSMMSLLGIVAVSGVVVNDSLILVNAADRFRAEGRGIIEAAVSAGTQRFRAVILTSMTTFIGLLPIMLENRLEAQFVIPMAISLAFGVIVATAITLLLVPVLIVLVERRH